MQPTYLIVSGIPFNATLGKVGWTPFWWVEPTEGDPGDSDPDNQSVDSLDGVPPMASPVPSEESYLANLSNNESVASETSNNPGYDLFELDSNEDHESIPDKFNLLTYDNEIDPELDHFLISPNENPLSLVPNRAQLDPTSNWLQSSSGSDTDPDHDQFLLNADDLYSDDAWSSYSSNNNDNIMKGTILVTLKLMICIVMMI